MLQTVSLGILLETVQAAEREGQSHKIHPFGPDSVDLT